MLETPSESRRLSRRLSFAASGRELAPAISLRRAFREFWPDTRGLRRLFAAGVVFAILATLCEVAAIRLFGHITDEVLTTRDLGAFWAPAFSWLGLAAVAGVTSFAGTYITALGAERFLLRLRDRVFDHIQTLAPDFSENRRLGDLMARLTDDVEAIEELVGSGLVKALTTAAGVVFFAGAAFLIRWDLALVTLALIPAFLLVSKLFAARFRTAAACERHSNGAMNSVLEEGLANQPLVQAYNRQRAESRRLHAEGRTWLRANMAQAWLSGLYGPAVQVIETACLIVILGFGAWEIAAGRLTIGGLLAFAAYLALLYPAVQSLGELALTVSEAAAGSDRIIEVLRTGPAVTDAPGAVPAGARGRVRGRVEFDRVGFGYPGRGRPVLREVSFAAEPGELLVLTGPSGAGKSTLAKLLLRFYDPDAGRVLLDGADVRGLTRQSLRQNVTVLHQETLLFSGSVRDNIAYGRPDASLDDVIRAAEAAGVHDFVRRLPQGYDTPVGQRGRLLSGGQRQRIAIARAVLRDAPVLVLDEPMNGLDEATAAQVMGPLRRLMAGRTTILITHDLRHVPEGARVVELRPVPREDRIRLKRAGLRDRGAARSARVCGAGAVARGRGSQEVTRGRGSQEVTRGLDAQPATRVREAHAVARAREDQPAARVDPGRDTRPITPPEPGPASPPPDPVGGTPQAVPAGIAREAASSPPAEAAASSRSLQETARDSGRHVAAAPGPDRGVRRFWRRIRAVVAAHGRRRDPPGARPTADRAAGRP